VSKDPAELRILRTNFPKSRDNRRGKYLNRRRILLVDDNRTHQYSLGRHIEESGFEVIHALTGEEALELASSRSPALILLDVNLPGMSGFQICESLKADPATRSIPVIFHSATHDTQSARLRALDLGAVSFLSYPVDIDHLMMVIQGTLAHESGKEREEEV
jgi:CheY-like chemotaxis protein